MYKNRSVKRFVFLRIKICIAILLLFGAQKNVLANEITNSDFESGNTGFTSEFEYSPGNIQPPSTFDVVIDPNNSHPASASFGDHTTGTGLMLAVNGSTDTDSIFWSQEVSVVPNTEYEFEIWTATWASNAIGATIQLRINSDDIAGPFDTPMTIDGTWQKTTLTWNSGASNSALLELVNLSSQFSGNDFAIDDLAFSPLGEVFLGDVNQDGFLNLLDVAPFVDLLTKGGFQPEADINQDGDLNLLDVAPFVELLAGG